MRVVDTLWRGIQGLFGLWWGSVDGLERVICSGKDSENRNKGSGGRVNKFWLIRGIDENEMIKKNNSMTLVSCLP